MYPVVVRVIVIGLSYWTGGGPSNSHWIAIQELSTSFRLQRQRKNGDAALDGLVELINHRKQAVGETPLHMAAFFNQPAAARALLQHGASPQVSLCFLVGIWLRHVFATVAGP